MDISEVILKINKANTKVKLHLVHRTISGKVKVVNPSTSSKFNQEIKKITLNQLNIYKNNTEEEYNIIGSNDCVVETESKNKYYKNIDLVINELDNPVEKIGFKNDSFDFFVYEFCPIDNNGNEEDKIFAFRRTKKFKAFSKGFIGCLINGYFNKIEDKGILGGDSIIDLIVYGDDISIFQHTSFERIFNLSNEFKDHAKKVLSNKKFNDKISNFDDLKKDALKNLNYIKRLSKLDGENDPTIFLDDIEETRKVISNFKLDIDEKDGKLVYRDDTQLGNFINLMQDAYYKTLIGKQNGVDKGR
ncbi:Kiwa anti-phage protein KwaB-like domain-containing protein [Apilactobacillus timberlakei]|uniref:Kiwa anti-phage protein KwaB-like domain-containing protein n=1 Tax=Apilactobacillus timberlakei TaxID=2008380 RepID=UPI0015E8495F|nr:Kiwa anti-phage protein KwaB-like domain-containing protein [Apilactobacillus timberlakei]